MAKFLLWALIILVVTYAFNINLPAAIGHLAHSVQQMHGANAGH